MEVADEQRYAKDLLADPLIRFVDRTFVLWVVLGLALPFGLGVAISGTVVGGLTAMLWGGAARIFLMHHATFSINSLCHFFGNQDYETSDESRNLAWLAIPTWGEAWHNTHHAFPTSYRHGADAPPDRSQREFIEMMEKVGHRLGRRARSPRAQARKSLRGRVGPRPNRGRAVLEHRAAAARTRSQRCHRRPFTVASGTGRRCPRPSRTAPTFFVRSPQGARPTRCARPASSDSAAPTRRV